MNTYRITATRENGTTFVGMITEATADAAKRAFEEIYRGTNYEITGVELSKVNVPATKDQERKALEQIKSIVDSLGPNSYVAIAFDGCFEDAERNINYDAAFSVKERCENLESENSRLEDLLKAAKTNIVECKAEIERKGKEISGLGSEIEIIRKQTFADDEINALHKLLLKTTLDLGKEVADAAARIVEASDDPEGTAFKNARNNHRTAKADLHTYTTLLSRVNSIHVDIVQRTNIIEGK